MIVEMLAYLAWILLTIGVVAFVFHILRFDQPRPVELPLRHDDRD